MLGAALLAVSVAAFEGDAAALLDKAAKAYASLDYDDVVKLAGELTKREEVPMPQRLEAYRLLGCALVVAGTPQEAEQAFRLLLRLRPDYLLPARTPPKIQTAFDKVLREERAILESAGRFARERKIAQMKLLDGPAPTARGGRVLPFELRFKDPEADIAQVRLSYRRPPDTAFSTLPLQRDAAGMWRNSLPAESTVSEQGFTFEYVVETSDAKGPLLVVGPLKIEVAAGQVKSARLPRWVCLTSLGLTAAAGITLGVVYYRYVSAVNQYNALSGPTPGTTLLALKANGDSLATATTAALVTTAVLAGVTVLLALFTGWSSD